MANKLSIFIITYNRAGDLLELLKNISGQQQFDTAVEEILLLNNASTDDYTAVTSYVTAHPELKISYIWSDENLGVARGRNKLFGVAKGDIYLSIDDDMVFTAPNDLYNLANMFDKPYFREKNTGIITFKVRYYDNSEVQVTAFPHKNFDKYKDLPVMMTYYFAGGAHIMRREVVETVGIYPADFHYSMEEYDLAYRALGAGFGIGYDDSVTVLHKESPLGRQPNYKKLQMQWVNKSKVAWRYLPVSCYFTTAVAWAVFYLKHAWQHPGAFLGGLLQILAIPFSEKRKRISSATLQYLHSVEARLKY